MSLMLSEVYDRLTRVEHKLDRLSMELRIYSGILTVLIVGVLWKVSKQALISNLICILPEGVL